MRFRLTGLIVLLAAASVVQANEPYVEFDPPEPLCLTDAEWQQVDRLRADIQQTELYQDIHQQADQALQDPPSPRQHIHYEGLVSNHPDRVRSAGHLHDMLDIRALFWAYRITENETYARRAIEYIHAWASTYIPTGNDVNENKLNIAFATYPHLKTLMKPDEHTTIRTWLRGIGQRQREGWSDSGASNRYGKRLKLILMCALALDDDALKTFAHDAIRPYLEQAMLPDGTTRDFHHRDSLHYHASCIHGILKLALLFRLDSTNLYTHTTPSGASLKACVHFMLPYIGGEKVHPEWVNSKVGLDRRRWESGDPYYRPGKPWDPREAHDTLQLASVFDPGLHTLARTIDPEPGQARLLEHYVLSRVTGTR